MPHLSTEVPHSGEPLSPGQSRLGGHPIPRRLFSCHLRATVLKEFQMNQRGTEKSRELCSHCHLKGQCQGGPRIGHSRNAEGSCSKEREIQQQHEGTTGAGKDSPSHRVRVLNRKQTRKKQLEWPTYGPRQESESRLVTLFI